MAEFGQMQERVTRSLISIGIDAERAREVAFHMTDWKTDLDEWAAVWESPDAFDDEQLTDVVYGFLIHVPNHVNAAKKLLNLGPIEDIFGVGIFEDKE